MVNKRFWLGILVMVLVFGLMVVGCDIPTDEDKVGDYTFEIAIVNESMNSNYIIIQIDFINGYNENDPVLQTEMVNLVPGASPWSEYYKVSGFTKVNNKDERWCGIKVFYSNGQTGFGYGNKRNHSKFTAKALTITNPFSVNL